MSSSQYCLGYWSNIISEALSLLVYLAKNKISLQIQIDVEIWTERETVPAPLGKE